MPMTPDGAFVFTELQEQQFTDLTESLGNTERQQLQKLAEEYGPLWVVQKSMLDYAAVLRYGLAAADLNTVEGLAHARKLQSEINAVEWQRRMWERILSLKPTEGETSGD